MLPVLLVMQVDLQVIFGDSWRVLRKVLTSDIQRAMDAYWSRARREEGTGQLISPSAEVHTMLLIHSTYMVNPAFQAVHCISGTLVGATAPTSAALKHSVRPCAVLRASSAAYPLHRQHLQKSMDLRAQGSRCKGYACAQSDWLHAHADEGPAFCHSLDNRHHRLDGEGGKGCCSCT